MNTCRFFELALDLIFPHRNGRFVFQTNSRRTSLPGRNFHSLLHLTRATLLGLLTTAVAFTPLQAADYYASPSGTPSADGSISNPWDLKTALNKTAIVKPSDTLWLRGGIYGSGGSNVYTCNLTGISNAPVVVRQYPGENARVNGSITAQNAYVTYMGFEIFNSSTERKVLNPQRPGGINVYGQGNKLINLTIHDTGHPGIGFWENAGDGAEVYGCIIWGNGLYDLSDPRFPDGWTRGSAIYTQNKLGTRYITDTIAFRNFTTGLNAYTENGYTDGYTIEGCTVFDHPQWSYWFTGGTINPMRRLKLINNYGYHPRASQSSTAGFGYADRPEGDIILQNNYFAGGQVAADINRWADVRMISNTFIAATRALTWTLSTAAPANVDFNNYFSPSVLPWVVDTYNTYTFDGWKLLKGLDVHSTFVKSFPTDLRVFIRPNKYQPGRANITVFNWSGQPSASLTLTNTGLKPGDSFEIRDTQNFLGSPVYSGIYDGAPVAIPLNLNAVTPLIGNVSHYSNLHTPSEFNAFVVLPLTRAEKPPTSNAPPAISTVPNQTLVSPGSSGAIPFNISDAETPPENLKVSVTSSNPTLIPESGLVLEGAGSARTITITPAPYQLGAATITLIVSDGVLDAKTSFSLTVNAPPLPEFTAIAATSITPSNATIVWSTSAATEGQIRYGISASYDLATALESNQSLVHTQTLAGLTQNTAYHFQVVSRDVLGRTVLSGDNTFTTKSTAVPGNTQVLDASMATLASPMILLQDPFDLAANYLTSWQSGAGTATFHFNLSATAEYAVWCRVLAPSYQRDSFFVSVDGGFEDIFDAAEGSWRNEWQWTRLNGRNGTPNPLTLNPRTFTLAAGAHFLTIRSRESFAGVSRIVITPDLNFVPSDSTTTPPSQNLPPVISTIPPQVIDEDTSTSPIGFSVADDKTPLQSLNLSLFSSDPGLLPQSGMLLGGTGPNRALTLVPSPNAFGSALVSVVASDGTLSSTQTFTLTVRPINDLPLVSLVAEQTGTAGTTIGPISFTVEDIETPADELMVSALTSDPNLLIPSNVRLAGAGSFRSAYIDLPVGAAGTGTVTFRVADKAGYTDLSFKLTILPANRPPTITLSPDQSIDVDQSVFIFAYATDDGLPNPPARLSYLWTQVAGPGTTTFGNPASRITTIRCSSPGAYTLRLTVSDSLLSTSGDLRVTVRELPPTISDLQVASLTSSNAIITWTTSVPADSQVEFGTTTSYGRQSLLDPSTVTTHQVLLAGLDPETPYHFRVKSSTAAGTLSVSSDATFQTTAAPVDSDVYISMPAEAGSLLTPMGLYSSLLDPNFKFVYTPTANQGSVTYNFSVPREGNYVIWCHVLAQTYNQDSFFVSVDDGGEDVFDVAEGSWSLFWQWSVLNGRAGGNPMTLNPRVLHLTPGAHTVKFRGRDSVTRLHQFVITDNLSFRPEGENPLVAALSIQTAQASTPIDPSVGTEPNPISLEASFPAPNQETIRLRVSPGVRMIGNPLAVATTIETMLPHVPEGTKFARFSTSEPRFAYNVFHDGRWSSPGQKIEPGAGGFVYNPGKSPIFAVFHGNASDQEMTLRLNNGLNLLSLPSSAHSTLVELLTASGTQLSSVYRYDAINNRWQVSTFTAGTWDAKPVLRLGEALYIDLNNAQRNSGGPLSLFPNF